MTEILPQLSLDFPSHNKSADPLFKVYWAMRSRCNPLDVNSKNHGQRGIRVCDEWIDDFWSFRLWAVTHGYAPGLEIDRYPNNDGNYEPANCRFVTRKINTRNRRSSRVITAWGDSKTVAEWMEDPRCLVKNGTSIYSRLRRMNPESAMSYPVTKPGGRLDLMGQPRKVSATALDCPSKKNRHRSIGSAG